MGTDIHMKVEVRDSNGSWRKVSKKWWNDLLHRRDDEPYEGRNYDLFAMLADVRNGYGFAGVDTGDVLVPIAMPRGLPEDVSEGVRRKADDVDWHNHSYLTVRELQEYDWNRVVKKRGVVSSEEYIEWKENGKPGSYCGGVGGPNLVCLSNDDMERYVNGDLEFTDPQMFGPFTQVEWEQPYYELAGTFLETALPRLEELGNPDDVRIVFWFDS